MESSLPLSVRARDPRTVPGRSARRSEEFVGVLYERHGSVLLGFAARLLGGDWHRAEDVLQEVAVRAWQRADDLDPTTNALRPWLFTVVRNLVIDGHRSRKARPPEVAAAQVPPSPVSDGVDHTLTRRVVVDAMRELAPWHREVLVHVYFAGRSISQTAALLGVPPGTVKSRVYYAMRALRDGLSSRGLTAAWLAAA
ncbi:sigma-70 family RNA polymerase sigma factor [Streptomyces sp. NPDC018045]|uniref:sigma-70 family RNA polymerase sigma factor n=1 Tax=Streptomyces sp. NPDC018045 TaxID=3365037 RepID=UPI0037887509